MATSIRAYSHYFGWMRNIGLQRRIMLYVALGLLILVTGFAFFALRAVNRSKDAVLQERLALAQTVAKDVDGLIRGSASQLEMTASLLFADPLRNLSPHEESMLLTMSVGLGAYPGGLGAPVHVYVTDEDGNPVWEWDHPDGSEVPRGLLAAQSEEIVSRRATVVKGLRLLEGPTASALIIGVPVVASDGEVRGAITAALVAYPSNYALFVPSDTQVGQYRLELIDEEGIVVVSSDQQDLFEPSRHLLIDGVPFLQRGRGVWEHRPSGEEDHVVAVVPLETIPWTVVLEQEEDVALALPGSLRRRIFLLSGIGISVGLLLTWITTRQVALPLTRLTEIASDIASGDLETPVAVQGQDEVRALSRSFESMRLRLHESLEEIEGWNRELEARVATRTFALEERNKERKLLLEKIITAQEDERKRVARELHDMVGQALTGLSLTLGSAEAEVGRDPDRMRERLEALRATTSAAIEDVRRLIADLRPSVLDDLGLIQALGWYVENYLEKAGIETVAATSGSDVDVPAHLETALFRVLQEAITNIIKHSQAQNVSIRLDFAESTISGEVRDDGVGFDFEEVQGEELALRGVGLLGMEERINLLGGSFEVSSRPGEGTVVTFQVPLEPGSDH